MNITSEEDKRSLLKTKKNRKKQHVDPAFSSLWEDFHELFNVFLKEHDAVP